MKQKIILFLLVLVSFVFISCSDDITNGNSTPQPADVIVLYEGVFPNSGDYAFINDSTGQVTNDVFSTSNPGAQLGLVPDGMYLRNNLELYITVQGNFGAQGRMYKINSRTNLLIDTTALFGNNPYSFDKDNNDRFLVSNIASDKVNLVQITPFFVSNITYTVGQNPSEVVTSLNNLAYVCKASYTTQNTLAVINLSNNNVTFRNFTSAPVSAARNNNFIYVSTYLNKKIYKMDNDNPGQTLDSIDLLSSPGVFTNPAVTDIVSGPNNYIYAVGSDTAAFGYTIGKSIYKIDVVNKTYAKIINGGSEDIFYGVGFEPQKSVFYIGNARTSGNHKVQKYDVNGNLIATYEITGKYPRRFAFTY